MASPDELEQLVAAGLVTSAQADSARRVDDDIAVSALGKLVCIGCDAKTLLPGYAQAFGLIAASDEALARSSRPPLPQPMEDALVALPAAPTWGADGAIEIVVTSAAAASELAVLGLPPHRVLVADEPRVGALLDRVLAGPPAPAPSAASAASAPQAPRGREGSGPSQKAERFLARPVREVDRRPGAGLNDPSQSSIVVQPFGAPPPVAAPFAAPAPSAGPVDAPFSSANPFASALPSADGGGNPFANAAAPFPSTPTAPSAPTGAPSGPGASLEVAAAPKRASAAGQSGPQPAAPGPREAQQREASREVPRPEPKRGPPIAAIAVGVVVVVALGGGGVMMLGNQGAASSGGAASASSDKRTAALDEARGKERMGEFAWAIAGYTRAVDDPRRDDDTADALLGRARCSIALGDREAALRDIEQVINGTFATPPMKQKAEALRASM